MSIKGSCIPVKAVYITGYIDRVLPSFYDDISCLPEIVRKVEVIQNTLVDILKMMFTYLNEWKGYRSIWRYDKGKKKLDKLNHFPIHGVI